MTYVACISRFPSGGLAEIFISNHKSGSDADSAAKDSAVVCSIALQTAFRSIRFAKPCCAIRAVLRRHRSASRSI